MHAHFKWGGLIVGEEFQHGTPGHQFTSQRNCEMRNLVLLLFIEIVQHARDSSTKILIWINMKNFTGEKFSILLNWIGLELKRSAGCFRRGDSHNINALFVPTNSRDFLPHKYHDIFSRAIFSRGFRGPRGPWLPLALWKKVIKKMAAERRLHRFHVSRPLIRPLDPLLILSLSLNWRWIYIVTFWTP